MPRVRKVKKSNSKNHMVWRIAVYIRLSKDDGNDESLSVTNQKKIIREYLENFFEEEYILVDDSILCKNPADGITYKVLLNDLRISRYVDYGIVKVGDTVQISYEGEIDETSGNTIAGAISAFKATISDGDVLISE